MFCTHWTKIESALQDYDQCIRIDPEQMLSTYRAIQLCKSNMLFDKGISYCNLMQEHHPDNIAGVLMDRGWFYAENGDRDLAVADYKAFLALEDPELEEFQNDIRKRLKEIMQD